MNLLIEKKVSFNLKKKIKTEIFTIGILKGKQYFETELKYTIKGNKVKVC